MSTPDTQAIEMMNAIIADLTATATYYANGANSAETTRDALMHYADKLEDASSLVNATTWPNTTK